MGKRKKINKLIRIKIFTRDGNKCLKCSSTKELTIDHITPLADGGTSDVNNLQTLCKRCNMKKAARKVNHRTKTSYNTKQNKSDRNGIYGIVQHGDQRIIVKK